MELASGVTEELIRSLGGIPQLDVRSRYVSRHLAESDPLTAARAMNLSYLVTGSLEATTDRLQLHAELVQPVTGRLVWSQSYDRPRAQLAGLMDEMSEVIASRVAGVVIPRVPGRFSRPTVDPLAYELYVRGRALFSQYSLPAIRTAIELLQQSVARDSTFRPAWGALGLAWILASDFNSPPRREATPHIRDASLHALALDSTDGLALANLAGAQLLELDLSARTESMAVRAVRLAPRDPLVLADACVIEAMRGDFEDGVAACRASVALDSASPLLRANLMARLTDARRFDEALAMVPQVDSLDPRHRMGSDHVPAIRWQMRQCNVITAPARNALDSLVLVNTLSCLGRRQEARFLLSAYLQAPGRHAGFITWFGVGEVDSAVAVMARAVDGGPTFDPENLLDVALDPYRRDPRVLAIMRRMGLEDGRPR